MTSYSSYAKCVDFLRVAGVKNASIVCYNLFELYGEESVLVLLRVLARRV
jgi:hypothetical protein